MKGREEVMREKKPFFTEFDRKFGVLMLVLIVLAVFVAWPTLS
jgi:hypothetical protein